MGRIYAGIPQKYSLYENSRVVLLPAPFDLTSTWGKGSDKGPDAFFNASENMELYDIETDSQVYKNGVFSANPVYSKTCPQENAMLIKSAANKYFKDNKLFTMIGGEHSVSIGAIMAATEFYKDLSVLQLDAHADLRPDYQGSQFNHACAMHWASKNTNLVQVGIRSMDACEKEFLKKENLFLAQDIINEETCRSNEILERLTDNVYLSIDLDCFDPSIMPSTGTPVPGGLMWYPVLNLLSKVAKYKNIIGFDIVELAPVEHNKAPDFLAAVLYYKLLSYIFIKG